MLPAAVVRDVYGSRKRRAVDFTSQDAQLIGRSRSERLLDGIFNRQSRDLRSKEAKRRYEQRLLRHKIAKVLTKDEENSNVKNIKLQERGAKTLKTEAAVNSLIKHVTSKPKFSKVVSLAQQLVDSAYNDTDYSIFFTLLVAIALSPCCTITPEARTKVTCLYENLSGRLLSSFNKTTLNSTLDTLPLTLLGDNPAMQHFFSQPISEQKWLEILSIPTLLHSKLYTDDAFQFNNIISRIFSRIENLSDLDVLLVDVASDQGPTVGVFLSALQERTNKIAEFPSSVVPFSESSTFPSESVSLQSNEKSGSDTTDAPSVEMESNVIIKSSEDCVRHDENNTSLNQIVTDGLTTSVNEKSPVISVDLEGIKASLPIEVGDKSELDIDTSPSGSIGNDERDEDNMNFIDSQKYGEDSELREYFLPTRQAAFHFERQFLINCLRTIQEFSKIRWANVSVTLLLHKVYQLRHKKFTELECSEIEKWQSNIKSITTTGRDSKHPFSLNIGEAANPVRDGREEKIVAIHGKVNNSCRHMSGASVWSAKQLGL